MTCIEGASPCEIKQVKQVSLNSSISPVAGVINKNESATYKKIKYKSHMLYCVHQYSDTGYVK